LKFPENNLVTRTYNDVEVLAWGLIPKQLLICLNPDKSKASARERRKPPNLSNEGGLAAGE
jgi:hypothetical protein